MRVRTEAKRCGILDTAASVFLEQGFERASMSEIAARIGGSKTTLYGYFRSKEELFVAVAVAEAEKQLVPVLEQLDEKAAEIRDVLLQTGERLVNFLVTPDSLAAHRMVLSEAGRSDFGSRFYKNGRQRGVNLLAAFLGRAHKVGKIRACDCTVAATHLMGLIESEWQQPVWFGFAQAPSRRDIRRSTERAVDVFLAAYGAA